MGLKNRLSKMKNFLFDEEPEREDKREEKKEKNHKHEVEEPSYEETNTIKTTILDDDTYNYNFDNDFDDVVAKKEEEKQEYRRVEKQEFTIPELTADDFLFPAEETRKPEPIVEQPLLYQASKKRKEERGRFKPSPNISPVYGLLDENGNKINDDKDTVDKALNNKDEVSLDDVRKKAYGKLDKEIEDTLKSLKSKTIEEAEKEQKAEEKKEELSREVKKESKKPKKEEVKEEVEEAEVSEEEEDEMILPSVNFKEINVDESEEKKEEAEKEEADDDDDEETKEQDLFNLIDTMYSKDGEE